LRNDHEIYLSNDFLPNNRDHQRVRTPLPGPEPHIPPPYSQTAEPSQPSPDAQFANALQLVREVVGTERRLTLEFAQSYERVRQWRERWGYSPLRSDEYRSPPPYSLLRCSPAPVISISSSPASFSPDSDAIPNPPITDEPEPTLDALFKRVNTFAKANGFGIARCSTYSYKGRKIRCSIRCDRFGDPEPTKGTGAKQRKSRKCGCQWMLMAEAIEEGKWLLRHYPNHQHS
ncbi:uncharacterized protein BCR38DRAFT_334384, partial [Pseudomassariella vexata]